MMMRLNYPYQANFNVLFMLLWKLIYVIKYKEICGKPTVGPSEDLYCTPLTTYIFYI